MPKIKSIFANIYISSTRPKDGYFGDIWN